MIESAPATPPTLAKPRTSQLNRIEVVIIGLILLLLWFSSSGGQSSTLGIGRVLLCAVAGVLGIIFYPRYILYGSGFALYAVWGHLQLLDQTPQIQFGALFSSGDLYISSLFWLLAAGLIALVIGLSRTRLPYLEAGVLIVLGISAGWGILQWLGALPLPQSIGGPSGPVLDRGHGGILAAMLVVFAGGLYLTRRGLGMPILLLLFGLGSLCLWVNETRGAWLAVILLTVGAGWVVRNRKSMHRRAVHLALILLSTLAIYGSAKVVFGVGRVALIENSGSGRDELWQDALGFVAHDLLTGHGWDSFYRLRYGWAQDLPLNEYRITWIDTAYPSALAHNVLLDVMVVGGLVGLMLYLWPIVSALRRSRPALWPWTLMICAWFIWNLTWYDNIDVTPLALVALGVLFGRGRIRPRAPNL